MGQSNIVTNIDLLNGVRASSSPAYQQRIPVATQNNIQEVMQGIMDFPDVKNEFIATLTQRVSKTIFFTRALENKLKVFHKGFLPYGTTIQGLFADIIKGKNFDDSDTINDLFGKAENNVKPEYYEQNYKLKYTISLSDERLKGAFLQENGLNSLIGSLIQAELNSLEYDEYLIMKSLLDNAQTTEVLVNPITDEQSVKNFVKKLRALIGKMGFPSNQYNHQGVTTQSKKDDLYVITTPDYLAEVEVETYAQAFNLGYADVNTKIVEVDSFADPDTIAIICDKDFIQFYDTLNSAESFRNGSGLYTNQFLHKWGIASVCGFANAVKLKTKLSTTQGGTESKATTENVTGSKATTVDTTK